jgi:hypothetical protein
VTYQHAGFLRTQELDTASCERLLAQASLGRVVLSVGCLPAALPVHVDLAEGHVLLGCTPGPAVAAAEQGDVVSIQVDGEEVNGTTWSVQVTGVARVVGPSDPLFSILHDGRLARALERGAVLVAVPLTVLSGERTMWIPAVQ